MAINTEMVQALGMLQGLLGNPMQELEGLVGLTTQMANQELAQKRDVREERQSEATIKYQQAMRELEGKQYMLRLAAEREGAKYKMADLKEREAARKSNEAIAGSRLRAEQDTLWQKQHADAKQARLDRAGNAAAILSRMPGSEKAALAALASLFEADDVSGLGAFLRTFEPEQFGVSTDNGGPEMSADEIKRVLTNVSVNDRLRGEDEAQRRYRQYLKEKELQGKLTPEQAAAAAQYGGIGYGM